MRNLIFLLPFLLAAACCGQSSQHPSGKPSQAARQPAQLGAQAAGNTIQARFAPPSGFQRMPAAAGSFASYLRHLPLKPEGSPVLLFDGGKKWRQDVHAAVVDLDVGDQDLQQCADAVMRLRAEYLYAEKRYGDISFHFTNGFPAAYAKWRQGQRISVSGNRCAWQATGSPSTDYKSFRQYLDQVFMYAGTLSLSQELKEKNVEDLAIGDVFIKGGSPGHAVIVVDVAVEQSTGEKVFLLAQSYMPAQEIHVLKNPADKSLSPWYSVNFGETLQTPEWAFSKTELKGF